jgi:hypothetical protein
MQLYVLFVYILFACRINACLSRLRWLGRQFACDTECGASSHSLSAGKGSGAGIGDRASAALIMAAAWV